MAWNLRKTMYPEVAQTIQEARKLIRSVENTTASLQPLTDGSELHALEEIEKRAKEIAFAFSLLYRDVAPLAFGVNSVAPGGGPHG